MSCKAIKIEGNLKALINLTVSKAFCNLKVKDWWLYGEDNFFRGYTSDFVCVDVIMQVENNCCTFHVYSGKDVRSVALLLDIERVN